MKKSIIAAGAASVALAAMPIVGVFAVTDVTDNITAVVNDGCSISNQASTNAVAVSGIVPGTTAGESNPNDASYAGITAICNGGAWDITAVGAGSGTDKTSLYGTSDANHVIPTGTADSGNSSAWAFKIADITGVDSTTPEAEIASGYNNYTTIPAGATPVVNVTKAVAVTVKPQYRVYVSSAQESDTYIGAVKYTVTAHTN